MKSTLKALQNEGLFRPLRWTSLEPARTKSIKNSKKQKSFEVSIIFGGNTKKSYVAIIRPPYSMYCFWCTYFGKVYFVLYVFFRCFQVKTVYCFRKCGKGEILCTSFVRIFPRCSSKTMWEYKKMCENENYKMSKSFEFICVFLTLKVTWYIIYYFNSVYTCTSFVRILPMCSSKTRWEKGEN